MGAISLLLLIHPIAALADEMGGVPLTGEYAGPGRSPNSDLPQISGPEESAGPVAMEVVPALSKELATRAASMAADEMIRVIVFLRGDSNKALASSQMISGYKNEISALRAQVKEILERSNNYRYEWKDYTDVDAENYDYMKDAVSPADRDTLRELNLRHEELSTAIQRENTRVMRSSQATGEGACPHGAGGSRGSCRVRHHRG